MTADMSTFLRSLSWSLFGTAISAFLFFIINILAGRLLGPTEYGKYNLVATISGVLAVFITLGFDTTVIKFVSSTKKEEDKNFFLSNALIIISISSIVILLLVVTLSRFLAIKLNTDKLLVIIGALYAIIFTFKTFFDSIIRALHKFKIQAFVKSIEALVATISFFVLIIVLEHKSYVFYVCAVFIAAIVLLLIYFYQIKARFRRWSGKHFQSAKPYAMTVLATSLATIVTVTIDRFAINIALGPKVLGIYSAYLISTTIIASQISAAITNVFFPTISKSPDKIGLMRKVDNLLIWIGFPFLIIMSLLSIAIIFLFGVNYHLNLIYVFLSSSVAFLQLAAVFYVTIAMTSEKLFVLYTKFAYLKLIIILVVYSALFVLKLISISSVLEVLAIASIYDIFVTRYIIENKSGD
ncbi:MAG: oligosaccharide flippase family protein [bacterium]|nr:oligosaccharide flippase family protein [bacterium]